LKPNFLEALELPAVQNKAAVALSGGIDSAALLWICLQQLGQDKTLAIHIDHACRSEKSRSEERQSTEKLCHQLGVPLKHISLKPQEHASEENLRKARYMALSKWGIEHKVDWIALGHHRDDQVETILHNLIRGTDLCGAGGMESQFLRHRQTFIRPLLTYSRRDLEQLCTQEGLPTFHDPSNDELCYRRNLIRHELTPLLREISPGFEQRLVQFGLSAKNWHQWGKDELLAKLDHAEWTEIFKNSSKSPSNEHIIAQWSFPRFIVQNLPQPLQQKWARQTLEDFGGGAQGLQRFHVETFAKFCASQALGACSINFPKGISLRARKREIVLIQRKTSRKA
jgi:tRNA(Ile)-lysidine synthetase-like protein